jgi:hypothetical protein
MQNRAIVLVLQVTMEDLQCSMQQSWSGSFFLWHNNMAVLPGVIELPVSKVILLDTLLSNALSSSL